MKKVLALIVALALVFTTLAGCIVTSAATTDITLEVAPVEVASAADAKVNVTGTLAAEAEFVIMLEIVINENLEFKSIDGLVAYHENPDEFDYKLDTVNGKTVIKSLKVEENVFSYAINVTAPANDTTEAVVLEDAIVVSAEHAAFEDDAVTLSSAAGNVTVLGQTPDEPTGPVVDSNLQLYRTTLAYGNSSLELNLRIANTTLALYDDVQIVVTPQKYDMTTLNLAEPKSITVTKADLVKAGSKYMDYKYTDIQLYELGLAVQYVINGYDAEGNLVAVSSEKPIAVSPVALLQEMAADTTNEAGFRTLMVDTLVVCDEVMTNVAKSYADSDLADTVAAGSVLDGVDISLATKEIGECNDVDNFVSYDSKYTQDSSATHRIRSSVAVGKVPYINFRVKDSANALDLNKLAITVTYTSKDSAGEHPYEKTFTGSALEDGTFINCTFAEVGFHDSDKDILFTVSYDGEKKCEWTYSIETYLNSQVSDPIVGAQSAALIKLGQSFRTYQGL